MARLKRLCGSTLIEAIVASVIFLIVFACSLDIITRMAANDSTEDYTVIEADHCVDALFARYGNGDYGVGVYSDTFSWGTATTSIEPYKDYVSVFRIAIRVDMNNSNKTMAYKRLIELSGKQ